MHPALWELAVRTAGVRRVAAVTDAMAAAGMPDGAYRLGHLDVEVVDRVARLAGGGAIAGSTATADALFRNVVAARRRAAAEALRRAVAMTATTPPGRSASPMWASWRPGAGPTSSGSPPTFPSRRSTGRAPS